MNNCENGNPTSTEFIIKIYKFKKELQFDLPYLPPLLKGYFNLVLLSIYLHELVFVG